MIDGWVKDDERLMIVSGSCDGERGVGESWDVGWYFCGNVGWLESGSGRKTNFL